MLDKEKVCVPVRVVSVFPRLVVIVDG